MASISDLIMQQVKSVAGGVQIPSDIQNQVLGGLSSSVLGSLTQTAAKPGGVDLIKNLLTGKTQAAASPVTAAAPSGEGEDLTAPLSGKFFLTRSPQEQPKKVGDAFKKGEPLCYIEAMKVQNAVAADFDGVITAILKSPGDSVDEDDAILKVSRS